MNGISAFKHGGNLYAKMRETGGSLSEILDFSANINPLGMSERVRQVLYKTLESVIHYPDAEAYDLKDAICQHYLVDYEWITVGNGAVELMYILCHMLAPNRVLVTAPTFSEYERAARASGAQIEYFYLNDSDGFAINIQKLIQQISEVDIIFICNPNNPTGTLLPHDQVEMLVRAAKMQNTYVVIDESFIDFLPEDSAFTCRHLLARCDNLILLHSLTKFYAIPGLRLGFSLANPQITLMLHAGKDPWNVNMLAQHAGAAALADGPYQQLSREFIAKSKMELYNDLLTIEGLRPYLPSVNFVLIKLEKTTITAGELREILAGYNILIRDCSNYPGLSSEYIRTAVKETKQNAILIETLRTVLGGIE